MSYTFFVLPEGLRQMRVDIFTRMQKEGLLNACMHSFHNPSEDDWLKITTPHQGWLLCCVPSHITEYNANSLCGVAWLEPWRGQVWTFDFTVFRAHFTSALYLSKAALKWIFLHAPCQSLVGLCAASNIHAWRLAHMAGFCNLGRIPGACLQARRNVYEDGVLVVATKENMI